MILFYIKKWFFDLWDNLAAALFLNAAFAMPLSLFLILPDLNTLAGFAAGFFIIIAVLLLLFIIGGVISRQTWNFARGISFHLCELPGNLKASLVPSLGIGGVFIFLMMFLHIGLPFYNKFNEILGFLFFIIVFWFGIFAALASQYFWPLNAQYESNTRKLFKKCFMLFFDNAGFTIIMAFGSAVIIILSALTMSIFPGVTGLLLWHQTGLKLRMYKYSYLENNPAGRIVRRSQIPWAALVEEERVRLGRRTLRNTLFPWKD